MKVAMIQSNYIPWKGYFHQIHDADAFVYYDEVQYTKNDWRNRNKIYTKNGLQWLTIPINSNAVHGKISEVELHDKYWQKLHHKSILLGYKSAPYFHQLEPLINEVYLERKWEKLIDVNRFLTERISIRLGLKTKFIDSKDYLEPGTRVERIIKVLKKINTTEFLIGPAAKNYMQAEENLFSENGIKLTYMIYPQYSEYNQRRLPFENYVSIIDMLANVELTDIPNLIWTKSI